MIEARHLAKSFHGRTAVTDISFDVGTGEIVGLLGTNGAGKSTTLRLLAGSLRPDRGAATIAGHDLATARREAQACLGYLPEAAAGFATLTVLEFLTFAAESRGYWGATRRVAIARAGEEGFSADSYLAQEQVSDSAAIDPVIEEVLAANPSEVEAYRNGKEGLAGFFVGQVMKATGGKANPKVVNERVREKLKA